MAHIQMLKPGIPVGLKWFFNMRNTFNMLNRKSNTSEVPKMRQRNLPQWILRSVDRVLETSCGQEGKCSYFHTGSINSMLQWKNFNKKNDVNIAIVKATVYLPYIYETPTSSKIAMMTREYEAANVSTSCSMYIPLCCMRKQYRMLHKSSRQSNCCYSIRPPSILTHTLKSVLHNSECAASYSEEFQCVWKETASYWQS